MTTPTPTPFPIFPSVEEAPFSIPGLPGAYVQHPEEVNCLGLGDQGEIFTVLVDDDLLEGVDPGPSRALAPDAPGLPRQDAPDASARP